MMVNSISYRTFQPTTLHRIQNVPRCLDLQARLRSNFSTNRNDDGVNRENRNPASWPLRTNSGYRSAARSNAPHNTLSPVSHDISTIAFGTMIHPSSQHRTMVTVTKTKASDLMNDTMTSDNDDEKGPTTKNSAASAENIEYIRQSDSLIVTDSCLNRIEKLIKQRRQKKASSLSASENEDDDGPYFLRVFVDAGGCSGFQYQFEVASDYNEQEDVVIVAAVKTPSSSLEPRVVVDETSLGFLAGSTLDYVIEMIKSSFTIRDNPKSESACGCGSSFAVKNFSSNPALD